MSFFHAMQAAAGAAGGRGARNTPTSRLDASGAAARQTGQQAGDAYMAKATGFDARSYANDAAHGAYSQISDRLKQDLGELRGDQAGHGRLNTGWGQGDDDKLYTGAMDRLNAELSRNAFTAAGLDQQNAQALGNYGMRNTEMANDLDVATLDRRTAERNARRQERAALYGSLAGAAGTFLGGGMGG